MTQGAQHNIASAPIFGGPTLLVLRREITSKVASPWLYAVASSVCLISWWYGFGFQAAFRTESVLVASDPLSGLNAMIIGFLGFISGLRLAASIAWEREHGTLQVLLSGPVTWRSVILAKFMVELCALLFLIVVYQLYLLLAQPLGTGVLLVADVLPIGLILIFALPLLALGLLVSAWERTVRGAVVGYLILAGLLGAFEVAHILLSSMASNQMSLTMLYLRAAVEVLAPVLRPMSALSHIGAVAQGVMHQVPLQATQAMSAGALTLMTLVAALVVSRWRRA